MTLSPEPYSSERTRGWPEFAYLDEPAVRSLNAFICELTATRERHDALRLISDEVRALLQARFVAVMVFEDGDQGPAGGTADAAAINVPLRVAGRNVGQITAYLDRPRDLSYSEARVMEVVAAVAAVTLDNAQLLQRERKRLKQSEVVNQLAPHIVGARTGEELARLVVTFLKDNLHYDVARLLWRRDAADQPVCLAAAYRGSAAQAADSALQDGRVAAHVLHEGTALLVRDQADWRRVVDGAIPGLRSFLAVPIAGGGGAQGVLEVGARSPRVFDNVDLATLTTLASQIASVGERLAAKQGESRGPALSEADRSSAELLSLLVHDLRGPLSLIKGYAVTLLRLGHSLEEAKRRRFLAGIDQASDQLTTMLDHVAGVSRIESGRYQPKLRRIDLAQLVTESVERLRPQLGEHPISLELPGEVLPVEVDYEHVGKVMSAFLSNAARQSPDGGRITVKVTGRWAASVPAPSAPTTAKGRHIAAAALYGVVEIGDEGPGIPRDQQGKVFARLYRVPGDGRKKGSSLELYAARRIVEAHSGAVWVESEPGTRSTLGFCVPLKVTAE